MSHGTKPGFRAPSSKIGRNKVKCERYRREVGKPAGPGMTGKKAGKGHVRHG